MVIHKNLNGDCVYMTESGQAFEEQGVVGRAILGCLKSNYLDVRLYEGKGIEPTRLLTRIGHTTPSDIEIGATPFELGFFAAEGLYVEIVNGQGAITLIRG